MSLDDQANYYDAGGVEVINVIKSKIESMNDGFTAYCLGNAIKYVLRAPYKGSMERDVEKAITYLTVILKTIRGE